jgi:hypothetical protein
MNRASILPLLFLFAASHAFAQQMSLTHLRTAGADCPVGIQVSHATGVPAGMNAGPTIKEGPAINGRSSIGENTSPGPTQAIHLTMTNPLSHDIVSARITAHGFSGKWKIMDLRTSSHGPDLAKTLDIALNVKGQSHASSDLSLRYFTAISSIDLDSVTYADGTTWRAPSPGACSVTPDLFMLIAAQQ